MRLGRERFDSGTPSGCLGGERRHQVYRALKIRALLYRFHPGQHLAVVELSDQLKVSNTPVREALIRLHAEGHVAAIPSRGFFARELRLREMQEIHDLMRVLLRHSLEAALAGNAQLRSLPDPGTEPSIPCDPRTALALARRTEAIFTDIAALTGSDVVHRTVADLCERTHHIRRCAYRSADLTLPLHSSLVGLIAGVTKRDGTGTIAAVEEYFGMIQAALPVLVMRALATSFAQDCT